MLAWPGFESKTFRSSLTTRTNYPIAPASPYSLPILSPIILSIGCFCIYNLQLCLCVSLISKRIRRVFHIDIFMKLLSKKKLSSAGFVPSNYFHILSYTLKFRFLINFLWSVKILWVRLLPWYFKHKTDHLKFWLSIIIFQRKFFFSFAQKFPFLIQNGHIWRSFNW